MHPALDARNLLNYQNGIGRSILEICKELIRQNVSVLACWPKESKVPPQGIETVTHTFSNHAGSFGRLIWSLTTLPRQANKSRPDIFWGPAHRLPIGLNKSIPCVVTIHDLVWAKHPETMSRKGWLADRILSPHAMRRANAIIAVSKSTRDDIAERFPHFADKVHVIYPGSSSFEHSSKIAGHGNPYSANGNYALFVGTIEPRKNLDNLLRTIAISKAATTETGNLLIAGGKGWRHAEINTLIDKYGLSDCVQALGYVSDAELAGLYRKARFLVMPSLYEGFGLPIIEAGSYGVPALTSNVSSMPEAAGKAGLLVDPHDPHDIARGWQRLWNDDDLYDELRSHARENAARFSWSKTVDEMLALFQDVIERHRQSHPQ